MSTSVSLVLFDLGDVVCSFDFERRMAEYGRLTGLPEPEIRRRLWDSGFSEDCDRGQYDAEAMRAGLCERLGVDWSRTECEKLQCLAFEPRPDVIALARSVARTTRTGLLTNNAPLLRDSLLREHPSLAGAFDPILFSCDLGAVKPQPEIYATAASRVGLDAGAILLVDDSQRNVASAQASGWQVLRFESAAQLEGELRNLGLI